MRLAKISRCHMHFFCCHVSDSLSGHSGRISLHLSQQGTRGLCLSISRDRIIWCHLYLSDLVLYHTEVSQLEGNGNFSETRSLV